MGARGESDAVGGKSEAMVVDEDIDGEDLGDEVRIGGEDLGDDVGFGGGDIEADECSEGGKGEVSTEGACEDDGEVEPLGKGGRAKSKGDGGVLGRAKTKVGRGKEGKQKSKRGGGKGECSKSPRPKSKGHGGKGVQPKRIVVQVLVLRVVAVSTPNNTQPAAAVKAPRTSKARLVALPTATAVPTTSGHRGLTTSATTAHSV